ncbi:PPE domain-containing protein [Mycobacterium sp.]|uniref:PPE family protein, SVP subgroup n=1 Tax=Mycobacterium sp. TaxID=1785 RepID=UPI0025D1AAC9|nr:PPE domain-containing protein [Mycobacterium sp.]
MYFGSYPPEINSARMYAGAGVEPLLVAAEAWDSLAGELQSLASSYSSVISGLTSGQWMGPAATSMSAAAASYAAWLRTTAAQAEQTGAQAKSAAAAYQAAFTATVPPPMVAANRSLLATLIATNLFGRNTQAIAANEAQYGEMWAQDAAAMYGYAASSAAATQLTPFNPPQQNTDPSASANQAAAVGQATGNAAGNAQSSIQQAFSAVPSALSSAAAAPAAAGDPLGTLSDLIAIFLDVPANVATFTADIPLGTLSVVALPFDVISALTGQHTDKIVSGWNGQTPWPGVGPAPVQPFPAPLLNLPAGTVPSPRLSAGIGEANTVGGLSVPPSWTVATPAVKPTAVTLPALPATTVAGESLSGASGSALSEMALSGMAGRAMAGTVGTGVSRARGVVARPTDTPKANDRKLTGGDDETTPAKPRAVITGVAAELREFTKLRDEGILTDEEYTEQKNRLLGR